MVDGNEIDAEFNAILDGKFEQAPTGNPAPQESANRSDATYKAAGREWKQSDFQTVLKNYDALHREMGTRNKDWAELKDLRMVRENLAKDPEFSKYFQEKIKEYQDRRAQGQPKAEASRATQLPPEVAAKLEKVDRFEKLADTMEYEREVADVIRKFKLSDEDIQKVEQYSVEHGGLELEASYKQMMFDLHQSKLLEQREAQAAKRREVSKTSGPTPDHAIPSAKGVSMKGDADWRKVAGSAIEKIFGNSE